MPPVQNRELERESNPAGAALSWGKGCRLPPRLGLRHLFALSLYLTLPIASHGVTYSMLLNDPKMNAGRFAGYFEYFSYEYEEKVQPADEFLRRERGDCDDYAVLADDVLRRRDLQTMLIRVKLAGMVAHDVCYVIKDRAYLDYNDRNVFFTLTRCRESLREIASKVASSLQTDWSYASIYTFSYDTGVKHMLVTIARTDTTDQVGIPPPPPRRIIYVQ